MNGAAVVDGAPDGGGLGHFFLSHRFLALFLAVIAFLSLNLGAIAMGPGQVIAILCEGLGLILPVDYDPIQGAALRSLRAPRVVLGAVVGGSLALCGAVLQGLFRNPLADPQLLGVSSGGAVGAAFAIILLGQMHLAFGGWADGIIPIGAFAGALLTVFAVLAIAGRSKSGGVASLLLAGIAINALCGALLGLLIFISDEAALRSITVWTMGSLGAATWGRLALVVPVIMVASYFCWREGAALNALLLGQSEAMHLGISVPALERRLTFLVALIVGIGVALTGVIGFVGLVVPHLYRLVRGPDHLALLPGSALLGAILLTAADMFSRWAIAPQELPIGIITGSIGAPFFIFLLSKEKGVAL